MAQIERAVQTQAFRDRFAASMLPLDGALRRLLVAAQGPAGLSVLLLMGRDPQTFDTAEGFAARLQYPLADMRRALASLCEHGILRMYAHPGQAPAPVSYWLPEDAPTQDALRRLCKLHNSGPAARYGILLALAASL